MNEQLGQALANVEKYLRTGVDFPEGDFRLLQKHLGDLRTTEERTTYIYNLLRTYSYLLEKEPLPESPFAHKNSDKD